MQVVSTGTLQGSRLAVLLYLSVLYSSISVTASLSQEKLLKDAKTVMSANIINYAIGFSFQLGALLYYKSATIHSFDYYVFAGFDVPGIRLIPILMALSGLSISLVLRYFDNIVKLICSSIAILFVHVITSVQQGLPLFNIPVIFGWFIASTAAYLYTNAPQSAATLATGSSSVPKLEPSLHFSVDTDDEDNRAPQSVPLKREKTPVKLVNRNGETGGKDLADKLSKDLSRHSSSSPWSAYSDAVWRLLSSGANNVRMRAAVFLLFGVVVLRLQMSSVSLYSVFSGDGAESSAVDGGSDFCFRPVVGPQDPRNNMQAVPEYTIRNGKHFAWYDIPSARHIVECPKGLYALGPDGDTREGWDQWTELSKLLSTAKSKNA